MLMPPQTVNPEILKRYPVFPVPIILRDPTRDFYDPMQFRGIETLAERDRKKHEGLVGVSEKFLVSVRPISLNDPAFADSPAADDVSLRERTELITDQHYVIAGEVTLTEYKMVSPDHRTDTLYSLVFTSADDTQPSTFRLAYSAEEGLIEHEVAGYVPFEHGDSPFDRAISHLSQASGTIAFN